MIQDFSSLDALRQACAEPLPHPSLDQLRACSTEVVNYILRDYAELPGRPVGRFATRSEMEGRLREPPPEQGVDFSQAFQAFQERVAPFGIRTNHPHFLAFIPGGPSFISILGDWLCAGMNFFAGVWKEAAGPTQVEILVLDWFRDFAKLPPTTRGLLTSGGSEANLTALVVARGRLPHNDRSKAVLYTSAQRHWSVDRAAMVIGLLPHQVQALSVDADQRLDADVLRQAIRRDREEGRRPWALVANAGTTNTGAVDPLAEVANVCEEAGLWFHVDAAYGWPALLTDWGGRLLAGIERADSVTLDPHKWFAQTFEAGCLLVRQGELLEQAFNMRPEYMQDVVPQADEINFADHGIALTRRFRALKIWLSMKVLGLSWHRRLVDHSCRLAQLSQLLLERTGRFDILSPAQLSMICFRYRVAGLDTPALNDLNRRMLEELCRQGQFFLSSTDLNGHFALRFCFINWRTTSVDVETLVQQLTTLGDQLAKTPL